MPDQEAGSRPSLLYLQAMRAEDGSPLPLAGYVCWSSQLQSFRPVSDIPGSVLLDVFRRFCDVGLERGAQ